MRNTITILIGVAMFPMATPAAAQALANPDKPIGIVVPFPVGGIADTFGREIGKRLTGGRDTQSAAREFISGTENLDVKVSSRPRLCKKH